MPALTAVDQMMIKDAVAIVNDSFLEIYTHDELKLMRADKEKILAKRLKDVLKSDKSHVEKLSEN